MSCERLTVFLPCHTLDDFPTWLDEAEAADVLASWTACWHPWLIAAVGSPPAWASIDLPAAEIRQVGIVPAAYDARFAGQAGAGDAEAAFVRHASGLEASQAAVVEAVRRLSGAAAEESTGLAGDRWADDFRALGLAVLLAELLARRMRSGAELDAAGFTPLVVEAARAAVADRDDEARGLLRDCFGCLEATRARYYPVDSWIVDLVLLAGSTTSAAVATAVASPVPLAVVATGETLNRLAAAQPGAISALRDALAAGGLGLCGGLDADRAIDTCTPEQLVAAFDRGRAAWREHVGREPTTFARRAGGGSALLPQVLAGLGYRAAIWGLFDGSPLPDPGGGRIRWQGGGRSVEAIAKQPLDARDARTILTLPESLGDAMDHDHAALVIFAHYAGTASPWHALLRRIGGWSTLLGTFVTPEQLVERTADSGLTADFEPDAFPPTLPAAEAAADPVGAAVAAARHEAARITAAIEPLAAALVPASVAPPAPARPPEAAGRTARGSWLWGSSRRQGEEFVLDNGLVRAEVHARTGGLLSLRRPGDRGNRISQQLALRTTRAAPAVGSAWQSAEERSEYSRMEADAVTRVARPDGAAIESRGRLIDAQGGVAGRFVQRLQLAQALPLALLDIELEVVRPLAGAVLENHAAARFAWHENEDVEIRRSLHTQAIATERSRLVAPHFIEIVPAASRLAAGDDPVTILTGGLPWHLLTSPHVLDTVLGTGPQLSRRIAIGVGIERPWDAAVALLAAGQPGPPLGGLPPNVRLTVHDVVVEAGRPARARVGLLEANGVAGEVRLEWGMDLAAVSAVDFRGQRRDDAEVRHEGRVVVARLARYEWLLLDVEFA